MLFNMKYTFLGTYTAFLEARQLVRWREALQKLLVRLRHRRDGIELAGVHQVDGIELIRGEFHRRLGEDRDVEGVDARTEGQRVLIVRAGEAADIHLLAHIALQQRTADAGLCLQQGCRRETGAIARLGDVVVETILHPFAVLAHGRHHPYRFGLLFRARAQHDDERQERQKREGCAHNDTILPHRPAVYAREARKKA
jgi:hypothetical protein